MSHVDTCCQKQKSNENMWKPYENHMIMGCLWPSLESITWCHMFCLMMLLGDLWVRLWETAFGSVHLPGCSVPLVAMNNRISFCCSTKEGHPSTCNHRKSLNSGRFFAILFAIFRCTKWNNRALRCFSLDTSSKKDGLPDQGKQVQQLVQFSDDYEMLEWFQWSGGRSCWAWFAGLGFGELPRGNMS